MEKHQKSLLLCSAIMLLCVLNIAQIGRAADPIFMESNITFSPVQYPMSALKLSVIYKPDGYYVFKYDLTDSANLNGVVNAWASISGNIFTLYLQYENQINEDATCIQFVLSVEIYNYPNLDWTFELVQCDLAAGSVLVGIIVRQAITATPTIEPDTLDTGMRAEFAGSTINCPADSLMPVTYVCTLSVATDPNNTACTYIGLDYAFAIPDQMHVSYSIVGNKMAMWINADDGSSPAKEIRYTVTSSEPGASVSAILPGRLKDDGLHITVIVVECDHTQTEISEQWIVAGSIAIVVILGIVRAMMIGRWRGAAQRSAARRKAGMHVQQQNQRR